MKNAMQWCKVHHEARTDPKLKTLSLAERGVWMNLLLFASEQQQRGTIDASDRYLLALECADGDEAILNSTIEKLIRVRHLTPEEDGTLTFRTWSERQYEKPSDRPEATRERKEKSRHSASRDVTPGHALEGEGETDPEKEAKTDQAAENTWQIDHPPTPARVVEAPPPPPPDLSQQVQKAAGVYSQAIVSFINRVAAAAAAANIDLVEEAGLYREKYLAKGADLNAAGLKRWIENELHPDRPREAKAARPPGGSPSGKTYKVFGEKVA